MDKEMPQYWASFVDELQRGVIMLDKDQARIGIWTYEYGDSQDTLIRQPPISPEMYYFGVYLTKRNNRWEVTGAFVERERLDLTE
jgi:hypothetical protein